MEARKLNTQWREAEPKTINHSETEEDYCHQIRVSMNRKHTEGNNLRSMCERTRGAVTCMCWGKIPGRGRLQQRCMETALGGI